MSDAQRFARRRRQTRRSPAQVAQERSERYADLLRATVPELAPGQLSHAEIARRTGIAEGWLRWTYPHVADLVAAAVNAPRRR
jgi:hypothetical protein